MAVVKWAAEECKRQVSGELSVDWMLQAWQYARKRDSMNIRFINEQDILTMARLIEPDRNANGYRKVDVRVGYDVKGPWEDVPERMGQFLDALPRLTPEEAYKAYEQLHPFVDGNGRTGSIIYCWLRGSLADPVHPPDWDNPGEYWGTSADDWLYTHRIGRP